MRESWVYQLSRWVYRLSLRVYRLAGPFYYTPILLNHTPPPRPTLLTLLQSTPPSAPVSACKYPLLPLLLLTSTLVNGLVFEYAAEATSGLITC